MAAMLHPNRRTMGNGPNKMIPVPLVGLRMSPPRFLIGKPPAIAGNTDHSFRGNNINGCVVHQAQRLMIRTTDMALAIAIRFILQRHPQSRAGNKVIAGHPTSRNNQERNRYTPITPLPITNGRDRCCSSCTRCGATRPQRPCCNDQDPKAPKPPFALARQRGRGVALVNRPPAGPR